MTRIFAGFLHARETRAVMGALNGANAGESRFVGGCVRNALMGREIDDIDIATQLTPDAVIAAAKAAGIAAIPTGLDHGTVTLVCDHKPFEVTTLRRDVSTDGRHAQVAFTTDWHEDAARRDFRLNALYANLDGDVFDLTGAGISDARAGRVVFIGDGDQRLREDYLRILRFFRFSAWYSNGDLDEAGLEACARMKAGLAQLSVERVWKELKKLCAAPDPRAALRAMDETGILHAIAPQAIRVDRTLALIGLEVDRFLPHDPLTRIAALLNDENAARTFAIAMKAANEEKARLIAATGDTPVIVSYLSLRDVRRALYALGREAFEDRVKLAWAGDNRTKVEPQWRALLALAAGWERPILPLSGQDVLDAGVPPGPLVGAVMREVEAWWIDADFTDDKLSVVERLKAVAQGMS
jgi:poly(A) polymerase